MANKTISGCYNESTKAIDFTGGVCFGCYVPADDPYHPKMIAITVADDPDMGCNDTYYACFDSGTGQFSVEVPDICCGSCQSLCSPFGTPNPVRISISEVVVCGCQNTIEVSHKTTPTFNINSIFDVPLLVGNSDSCQYRLLIEQAENFYLNTIDCSGNPSTYWSAYIDIYMFQTYFYLSIQTFNSDPWNGGLPWFEGTYNYPNPRTKCLEGSYVNQNGSCSGWGGVKGTGGTLEFT